MLLNNDYRNFIQINAVQQTSIVMLQENTDKELSNTWWSEWRPAIPSISHYLLMPILGCGHMTKLPGYFLLF